LIRNNLKSHPRWKTVIKKNKILKNRKLLKTISMIQKCYQSIKTFRNNKMSKFRIRNQYKRRKKNLILKKLQKVNQIRKHLKAKIKKKNL
jgi:hypothetical protein